jgi:hypothetical protein
MRVNATASLQSEVKHLNGSIGSDMVIDYAVPFEHHDLDLDILPIWKLGFQRERYPISSSPLQLCSVMDITGAAYMA